MEASTPGTVFDMQQILDLLPHRYPFLFVDRVEQVNGDESCVGIKNVTFNEPFFQGHFPGRPVLPGVLMLEGMAQSAGCICIHAHGSAGGSRNALFLTVDKAKFRRPVVPGDRLEFHMRKLSRKKNMWWYRGEAKVDGRLVCEAEVGAMFSDS